MAGLFSESTLEQIRAASDIVDVIGSYIPLKKAGANFTALCPFHKEKSPSFNVNASRQIFHCFGCHKGGDVFTFVKEYENISFVEAVKRLADRAHIPIETEKDGAGAETRHLKDTLLQIHEQITQRWQNALENDAAGQIARDYLAKRGVSAEAVKLFRLGYAPDAWDDTVNWAKSKNFGIADVEKAGLVIRKEETDRYYDRFRGRLMFPICDEQGRVIGFSGRVLSGDEKTAKYVNSPETPIFTKSKVFFGLDKSKRAILDAGFAIVCEGQLDLIACYMAGIKNIVAPQGTAFTAEHSRILKRYAEKIVLCFDSDSAGRNATFRSLDVLLEAGHKPLFDSLARSAKGLNRPGKSGEDPLTAGLAFRVAVIPPPHDPDSYIKQFGSGAFLSLIENAPAYFDYMLNGLCALHDPNSDEGRRAILKSMAEAVFKSQDMALIDKYAHKTAARLGILHVSVLAEFKKVGKSVPAVTVEEDYGLDQEVKELVAKPTVLEAFLIKLLLAHDELVPWALEHLAPEWVEHATARGIVEARFRAAAENTWRGVAALLDGSESLTAKQLITELATTNKPIPNPTVQIADVATRLRNLHIDHHRATLRQKVQDPSLDDAAREKLLREDHDLRVLKQVPIPPPQI